ncbi:hypothetical protein EJ03DRAFT_343029 [Teratosphaeria nubilosa]|uniref:N-acetyltransferase domain-containing protein n=1 Tax=Teratosphaeria nubilosa TaxID=161662 RepID=A0A6G1LAS8_9PEZI|nr:hypothetical protein EJ03DRAFT_343029 [Teratosphaeria nubilosa]
MPLMDPPDSPASSSDSTGSQHHYMISTATVADVRRLVDIEFHAFENERANQQLSFRDQDKPDHLERTVQRYGKVMRDRQAAAKRRRKKPSNRDSGQTFDHANTRFLKVTDVDTGDIVSFAKTEIKTYTKDELVSAADSGHEQEPQMNRDWFALNERLRREYMGTRRHCYIAMLATEPRFQHNGAGTMLLESILADADDAGLEVYLEGTDTAKAMYLKHGFRAVNDIYFDPSKYGMEDLGIEHQTVMVRGALVKDGSGQRRQSCVQCL